MKIRAGFVSNSSSSSFIVTNKKNWERVKEILKETREDYYIFKDVLYTSPVYENDYYKELQKLSSEERVGEIGGSPYGNEDEYVEIDGERGVETVWIERNKFTDKDLIEFGKAPYYLSSMLYLVVQRYFDKELEQKPSQDELYDFVDTLRDIYNGEYEACDFEE